MLTVEDPYQLKEHGFKLYILSNSNKKDKIEKVANTLDLPYESFAKKPLKRRIFKSTKNNKSKS